MHAERAARQGAAPASNVQRSTRTGADLRAQARGMSFEDGAALLAPVQLKGGVDYLKKKELPDEIRALGLKKVKVKLEDGAWESLEADEKQGVINFLTAKEAEILGGENRAKKNRIKSSTVTITENKVRALDDEELVDLEAGANKNLDNLNAGKAPEKVHSQGKVIGVDPGNVTVEQTYTTSTTMVSGKEKVTKEADFKSGESTFLSAEYTQDKMLENDKIMQLMEQVKAQIETYLAQDPNAKITVVTQGSESKVTPPPSHPNVGDLAQARADNGDALVRSYLAGVQGLNLANVSFEKVNLCKDGAAGPEWPKGLSKEEANKLKMDPKYTQWQFVNFKVTAEMSVDSPTPEPVTTTNVEETTSTDAEVVKMGVTDERKGRSGGGSNSFSPGNKGRVRGNGLVKGWEKDRNKNSCGGAK